MSSVSEEVTIRIAVKGDLAKKYNYVKNWYGLVHDTEVLRVLVSAKYHSIVCERE